MKIKSRCTVHMHAHDTIQNVYPISNPRLLQCQKIFFTMGASTLPMLPATEKTILAPAPDKKLTCSCGCCFYAFVYFIRKIQIYMQSGPFQINEPNTSVPSLFICTFSPAPASAAPPPSSGSWPRTPGTAGGIRSCGAEAIKRSSQTMH